ncbi:MAG: ABC transporter ATP-binding protein, partial [Tetrasphaera sp.]|nr:ABC transporter ATP-binding protein [Tetrasphaera sp.]
MEGEILIDARGVSKRFASYHRRATSLKERMVRREQSEGDVFWALRDVDLQVRRGETVGLTGPNGSGKSTLLKVLSGILRPNDGTVEVRGRVASLLELGAGFDGELTGRENVYLNSALLGVPREETDRLFEAIVDFSELGPFIDYPVKHYSSGMYVRLGFAVAVHVDPDILIVDEVLAVGDAAFQRKCLARIEDFQRQGKTILFVSHAAGQIESLCTRAVLLDHGRVLFDGTPRQTIKRLNKLMGVDGVATIDGELARIIDFAVVDPSTGAPLEEFVVGACATVSCQVEVLRQPSAKANFSLHVNAPGQPDAVAHVTPRFHTVPAAELTVGTHALSWQIEEWPDMPGDFSLGLGIFVDDTLMAAARIDGLR